MLIVLTGNGKGKTTSALGQAVRALGHNKRVLMIQFIKGPWESGEENFFKKFPRLASHFQLIKCGKGFVGILGDKLPFAEHKKAAQKALKLAQQAINPPAGGRKWDLLILDEINVAAHLKLIKAADVLKIVKSICGHSRHSNVSVDSNRVNVILTGRNAPKSFIKAADLATEMKEIKHPFRKGKTAKAAVEF